MGGIRTAGDLVAWMQLTRRMKIDQAKAYVAQKLDVNISDLTDETAMAQIRGALGLGSVIPDHVEYMGIAAKSKVAELLDVHIHSVDLYKKHLELSS
jgi:dimethylamine--corrinoid protein Co-methyltransferase